MRRVKVSALIAAALLSVMALAAPAAAQSSADSVDETECYRVPYTQEGRALAGNTVATGTIVGAWCVDGPTVTDAALLHSFSESSTPFWNIESEEAKTGGAVIIDNEARIYKRFAFKIRVPLPWFDFELPQQVCARIDGTAQPSAIGSGKCTPF